MWLIWIAGIAAVLAALIISLIKKVSEYFKEKKIIGLQRERDEFLRNSRTTDAQKREHEIGKENENHRNRIWWAEVISIVLIALGVAAQTLDSYQERKAMSDKEITQPTPSELRAMEQQVANSALLIAEMNRKLGEAVEKIDSISGQVSSLEQRIHKLEKNPGSGGPPRPPKGGGGPDKDPRNPHSPSGAAAIPDSDRIEALENQLQVLWASVNELERKMVVVEVAQGALVP
jgi:uncharacterized coiled-coil protein SlyX